MLGNPPPEALAAWRAAPASASLPRDTLERISYVLGIDKALRTLIPDGKAADAWVRLPNDAAVFGGASALERMLAGNVGDLYVVRRYLDIVMGAGLRFQRCCTH